MSVAIIKIDPDIHCKTQEEWDANELSGAWHSQWGDRNLPHRQALAYSEPRQFPCIGIMSGFGYNPTGPDWQHILWLYDFEMEEDE